MFCDVCLEIWVSQVGNERPNDHQEGEYSKSGIDQQPNGPLAKEGGGFEGVRCRRIDRSLQGVHMQLNGLRRMLATVFARSQGREAISIYKS